MADGHVYSIMKTVALIGAGQLGSRHLQGLMKVNTELVIEVVDPSEDALELARQRAAQVEVGTYSKSIKYLNEVEELSSMLDICIVATGAAVRLKILDSLLKSKKVRYLILEKVLFQSINQYEQATILMKTANVKVWVNCPRRLYPVYQEIKSKIQIGERLTVTIIGGEWGLACNSIHFIDLMSHLGGISEFVFDTAGIDEVIESKRKGYSELVGTLVGKQPNGTELFLHSRKGSPPNFKIQILSNEFLWQIDESNGLLNTISKDDSKGVSSSFSPLYQSELTNVVCDRIIKDGDCDLTPFEDSIIMHQALIGALLGVFNSRSNTELNSCPIT